MKITRLVSFMLAAVLLLCSLSACGKKDEDKSKTESSESDFTWDVPDGDSQGGTEDFDNTDDNEDTPTPTPGQNSGNSGNNNSTNNGDGGDNGGNNGSNNGNNGGSGDNNTGNQKPDENKTPESAFQESVLVGDETLLFSYEGEGYTYGITQSMEEILAFRDASGKLVDAISGGGRFRLVNEAGNSIVSNYSVVDFIQGNSDNNHTILTVNYKPLGGNASTVSGVTTSYTFNAAGIDVVSTVSYSGSEPVGVSRSRLAFSFLNSYEDSEMMYNTDWKYPEDGDFPYKEMDAWCVKYEFDEYNSMYTFLRSENKPNYIRDYYNRYSMSGLPLYGTYNEGAYRDVVSYSIAFTNCSEEKNPDYRALFGGKSMPVATGVEAVTPSADGSTVFVGDSVKLNLNVTNLTKNDVRFNYRYDIRDYYGNIVNAGLYLNSTVFGQLEANRIIDFKPGYSGIFFLNLMIVTEDGYSYREYYPFALLDKYDYKYQETSPFGIGQILGGKNEPYLDYLELASKIGVAVIRATPLAVNDIDNSVAFIKKAQEEKMRIFATGQGSKQYIDTFSEYGVKEFVSGNELNVPVINGTVDIDTAFDDYWNNFFMPGYNYVTKQGYKNIIAAVGGGQTAWYDKIAAYGGWDKFDTIALHPYGYPYSPDLPIDNIWHVESSLKRHVAALEKYGYKETYVTETGYPTVPGDKRAVCLRTQADYNMRCYILSLAYGANAVMAYCFTDYANAGVGVDDQDKEFNFGCFYYPDYFGRILPKPSAVMFANMTRQLESVKKTEINRKYDDGDKLRVFTLDTELDGDVLVAWSNDSRLPNDELATSRPNREYRRPWENQWHGSQVVTFGTDRATVEVIDTMGNIKTYKAENGAVSIALTGSPVIIKGAY